LQIADQDGNGTLSQEEIFGLSKICLGKFIKETPSGFLHELCEYFTKLIFETLGYDIDDEIPLEAMKDAIFSVSYEGSISVNLIRETKSQIFWLCFVVQMFNFLRRVSL